MNPVRGEAIAKIGGGQVVLAATIEAMAQLSQTSACTTMQDLCGRLLGIELFTTLSALRAFAQSGTDENGKELARREAGQWAAMAFTLADADQVRLAFTTILAVLFKEGNDKPGK
jgi:hypothetical protein